VRWGLRAVHVLELVIPTINHCRPLLASAYYLEDEERPVQVKHHQQKQEAVEQSVMRFHPNAVDGCILQRLGECAAQERGEKDLPSVSDNQQMARRGGTCDKEW
jgi:hypothetical protein